MKRRRSKTALVPRVLIVGSGRTGGALALGLRKAGFTVSGFVRSTASARRWKRLGVPLASAARLANASLVFLTVPDPVIAQAARALLPMLSVDAALVHCAGALSVGVFQSLGKRPLGSFHPLCALSDPRDSPRGCAVAIQATQPALKALLRRAARALGMNPFEVPEAARAAYHAGAVLAASGVVTVLSAAIEAWQCAGLKPAQIQRALFPLTESAMRGVRLRGVKSGLTGPVPRGDADRVANHLRALPLSLRPLYRALGERTLEVMELALSPAVRRRMESALSER